jgi:hypothetical protein
MHRQQQTFQPRKKGQRLFGISKKMCHQRAQKFKKNILQPLVMVGRMRKGKMKRLIFRLKNIEISKNNKYVI